MSPRTVEQVLNEVRESPLSGIFNKKVLAIGLFVVLFIPLLVLSGGLFETTSAGTYLVKQAAGSGKMMAYTQPGMFFQGFGDVFKYRQSDIIYFSKHENEGGGQGEGDDSISVQFNDGAKAKVTGNVRIELPSDPEKIIEIHKMFRSYDALTRDTIKQVVSESVILTAALMSAEESYTTKRAEFSQLADDQLRNGIYLTEADWTVAKDPKTGEEIKKQIVDIQLNKDGKPMRKTAPLAQYGIRVSQFVIKEIDYEESVDNQIKSKQEALMTIVSSKAQAEKAQQQRITAEEEGKMKVATARYEQEVVKAREVTAAEKELEVARLGKTKAEFEKQTKILQAEGEGEYRRKIMVADGALQQKLNSYVEVQKAWADAYARRAQPDVPSVVMGGEGKGNSAASDMMNLLSIKAARDLQLDLKPKE